MRLKEINHKKRQATKPISIRLSPEERVVLANAAGKRSLSEYIRERLFGLDVHHRQVRSPKTDARLLAQLLGRLGQSEIASNLRELAHAAKTGSFSITPDAEKAIHAANLAVMEIRRDLMRALGLAEGNAE